MIAHTISLTVTDLDRDCSLLLALVQAELQRTEAMMRDAAFHEEATGSRIYLRTRRQRLADLARQLRAAHPLSSVRDA